MSARGYVQHRLKSFVEHGKVQKLKKQDKRISARLTAQERQRVEQLIAEGKFKNLTDFVRTAISRLLETA